MAKTPKTPTPAARLKKSLRKADYEAKAKYYSSLMRTQAQRISMAKTPTSKASAQRKLKRLQISLAAAKARSMGKKPVRNPLTARRRRSTTRRRRTY